MTIKLDATAEALRRNELLRRLLPQPSGFEIKALSCVWCPWRSDDRLTIEGASSNDVRAWLQRHAECETRTRASETRIVVAEGAA